LRTSTHAILILHVGQHCILRWSAIDHSSSHLQCHDVHLRKSNELLCLLAESNTLHLKDLFVGGCCPGKHPAWPFTPTAAICSTQYSALSTQHSASAHTVCVRADAAPVTADELLLSCQLASQHCLLQTQHFYAYLPGSERHCMRAWQTLSHARNVCPAFFVASILDIGAAPICYRMV
jgi:hypothetical protein